MKIVVIFFMLFIVHFTLNAFTENCAVSSFKWKSEKEALNKLEKIKFLVSESFINESESWLLSANYYSCDGKNGYLVIRCQKKYYLHSSVPMVVWTDLKNARSKGGFYNFYIKEKYPFNPRH